MEIQGQLGAVVERESVDGVEVGGEAAAPAGPQWPQFSREQEHVVAGVLGIAQRFVRRWPDAFTLGLRDDLAQQATIETLRRYHSLLDRDCLPGFVRTIARRVRYRAMLHAKRDAEVLHMRAMLLCGLDRHERRALRVAARWVDREVLLGWLEDAMRRLAPLNAKLLREYYAGASCRELAARYRLAPETVKVRLHRSRERIRSKLEQRAALSIR